MALTLKHCFTCLLLLTLSNISYAASPEKKPGSIVVTIKPLYSLVAHLCEGIEEPVLLMQQTQSPHHYNMRPSERRLLANARVIVWIGPEMESNLSKVIQQQNHPVISAMQAEGLTLLTRRTKNHASHSSKHQNHHRGDPLSSNNIDPHIWLSSKNAEAISKHLSQQLSRVDPTNAVTYQKNLQQLLKKIRQSSTKTRHRLQQNRQPFLTHHDAFQYFEHENTLNHIASISGDKETTVSLKHLRHIKSLIKENNIHCLLYQPPKPDIIESLTSHNNIKAVALDPLAQTALQEKEAWFEMMENIRQNVSYCLSAPLLHSG